MDTLHVPTTERHQFVDITSEVEAYLQQAQAMNGMVYIYCPHTTCGLTIQENADPGVQHDMLLNLQRLAPRTDPQYRHIENNSASHLQASCMGFNLWAFVQNGRLVLGRWQALYLCEFDGPRQREVYVRYAPA
ncbi:MAG: secondary thiamine-phosphate synthase enzyme YjbQ [Herpetosiphon sp.]